MVLSAREDPECRSHEAFAFAVPRPLYFPTSISFPHSLEAGHRLRLDISSSNFPHLPPNRNTGNDPATDDEVQVATQTILHGAGHPGYVELSVVPDLKVAQPWRFQCMLLTV